MTTPKNSVDDAFEQLDAQIDDARRARQRRALVEAVDAVSPPSAAGWALGWAAS